MSVDNELLSLVKLFDDTDQYVISAVNERMLNRGESVIDDLGTIFYKAKSDEEKDYIAEKISFLSTEFTLNDLAEEISNDYSDLKRGLFLITKLILVDLEEYSFDKKVYLLLTDMHKELRDSMTAMEKVGIFNHIFYERLGFISKDYPLDDVHAVNIFHTLNTKKGTQIAMSLVYYLLARNCGLDIYPICFQGGFAPAYVENGNILFYIDVIKDGDIFSKEKLLQFFQSQDLKIDEDSMEIRDDKVLMTIYLETLLFAYTQSGEDEITRVNLERALDLMGEERFLSREDDDE
ncbi:MAG: transglutaminase family protein [Bacteroidales bacterium]